MGQPDGPNFGLQRFPTAALSCCDAFQVGSILLLLGRGLHIETSLQASQLFISQNNSTNIITSEIMWESLLWPPHSNNKPRSGGLWQNCTQWPCPQPPHVTQISEQSLQVVYTEVLFSRLAEHEVVRGGPISVNLFPPLHVFIEHGSLSQQSYNCTIQFACNEFGLSPLQNLGFDLNRKFPYS